MLFVVIFFLLFCCVKLVQTADHTGKKYYSSFNKFTGLGCAISIMNPEIVEAMIKHGAYVNESCMNDAWNSLYYTISKMSSKMDYTVPHYSKQEQEEMKVEFEKKDRDGLKIIEILLKAGADIHAKSPQGEYNALGFAISKGLTDVVKLLLKEGKADVEKVCFSPNAKTHQYTPLGLATAYKFDDIAAVLKSSGAKETPFLFNGKKVAPMKLRA